MAYPPPTPEEVAADYASALSELTFNSKPIITSLTIIAGENLHAAAAIARTVEARIQHSPPDRLLPAMYLMDSIVKNIGGPFVGAFGASIVPMFTDTYSRSDPSTRAALIRLLSTWQGVFTDQALAQCATFVTQVRPASRPPSPAPFRQATHTLLFRF